MFELCVKVQARARCAAESMIVDGKNISPMFSLPTGPQGGREDVLFTEGRARPAVFRKLLVSRQKIVA